MEMADLLRLETLLGTLLALLRMEGAFTFLRFSLCTTEVRLSSVLRKMSLVSLFVRCLSLSDLQSLMVIELNLPNYF